MRPESQLPARVAIGLLLAATVVAVAVRSAPALAAAAAAQPARATVLILDSSGSMWAKIGKETRVEIARRSVANLLRALAPASVVGVVAYGHRRDGDCTDIEVVAPLAPLRAEPLISRLATLQPKGKTPLAASVEAAFRLAGQQPANIVLVSDGLETCDPDPCGRVAKLRGDRSDLVLHVVGFGIDEGSPAQLECLAQAGGGLYFPAADAAGLDAALRNVQTQATTAAVGDALLEVGVTVDGKLADASVRVFSVDDQREIANGRTYTQAATNPRRLTLPSGTYDVEVSTIDVAGGHRRFAGVVVVAGTPKRLDVELGSGEVVVTVTRNGELSDATVQVLPSTGGKAVAAGRSYTKPTTNPLRLRVPAGSYVVEVGSVEVAGAAKVRRAVELEPGASIPIEASFAAGVLRVGARQGGAPVDATVTVRAASGDAVDSCRTYTKPSTNPCVFTVPPGHYRIVVGGVGGDTTKRTLDADVPAGGEAQLDAELGGT